jgi:glycosyltransferase involved in cell wall biosynthesis
MGDRAVARQLMGIDKDDRLIMQVARFHPVKDHDTAVRAFAQVADQVDRARLVLIGDGPQRSTTQQLASDLHISSQVTFMGVRDDVLALLPGADVFMLSSLSEGVSVTMLEAMATGLPICTTHVGGNSEVVDHGRTGLLSPRRDHHALAQNLQLLLTHPHMRAQMGENARQHLGAQFSQIAMHQAYARLYDAML